MKSLPTLLKPFFALALLALSPLSAQTGLVNGKGVGITDPAAFRDAVKGLAVIDVRNYPGVVGDGTNDDTAGIQLAINAAVAAKRPLYFGPVSLRYRITDTLLVDGSLPGISGTGMHPNSRSVIRQTAANKGAFIIRRGASSSHSYTRFHDLRIEGSSNVTTAAANTKGLWFDSEEISSGVFSFFDECDVERVYVSGFTWGFHASKFSNAQLVQLVCEDVYNGFEFGSTNNNSVFLQNCFVGNTTNIAWIVKGANTNFHMMACEAGGRRGNGSKALYVESAKVCWYGGNLEDFTGIRAPDTGNTTPGIVEVGINGEAHLTDVTFLNGSSPINGYSYSDAVPFVAGQFNGGGSCTRVRVLGFTAGVPTAKIYSNYSDKFRLFQSPGNGGAGVWIYADHTFSGTPAKLREMTCATYSVANVPAASQARAGEVFATYDDGGATPEQRWVVAKTGTGVWSNVLLTPPATSDFTVISGTTGSLEVNKTYHANNDVTRVQRLLPASANLGDEIKIYVYGAAGMRINQNAAAGTIMLPNGTETTAGTSGYLTAEKGASLTLRCFFTSGGGYWLVVNSSGTIARF